MGKLKTVSPCDILLIQLTLYYIYYIYKICQLKNLTNISNVLITYDYVRQKSLHVLFFILK